MQYHQGQLLCSKYADYWRVIEKISMCINLVLQALAKL